MGNCVAVAVGASKLIENGGLTALTIAGIPRVKICVQSRPNANDVVLELVQTMVEAARTLAPLGSEFAPPPACHLAIRRGAESAP